MVRARGVSVSLLGRAGDSHPPVLHWGTLPLPELGFVRGGTRRRSQPADGGQTSWARPRGRGPPLSSSSRRPLAWRGVGERRDGRSRTGSLVPVKNILCRSRVDRGAKATTCCTEPGAGPTTAAVPCAGSRQAGSGRMDAIMPRRAGTGTGVRPPARSLAGPGCPDRSVPNSSTHESTPPADVLNKLAAVAWAFCARATIANCVARPRSVGGRMIWDRSRPNFADFCCPSRLLARA